MNQVYAGIDIGTNTILLLVAESDGNNVGKVYVDEVRIVRLGEGLDRSGEFCEAAIQRARACFDDYRKILDRFPGVQIRAVATAGARAAKNAQEFFDTVAEDYRIRVEIISGEEEAQLSFLGSVEDKSNCALLDIGGGSTEVMGLGPRSELIRCSFPIGCVRMTERFLVSDPPTGSEVASLERYVRATLSESDSISRLRDKTWIGVAGTPTYLSAVAMNLSEFLPEKVHKSWLTLRTLNEVTDELCQIVSQKRLGLGGMDEGRADVIVAGGVILKEVLQKAEQTRIQVSVRGLRYGIVLAQVQALPKS